LLENKNEVLPTAVQATTIPDNPLALQAKRL
jgi:hypothetical protein